MRAKFSEQLLQSSDGREMNEILRSCVHCGFCNATCPTYQLQGDELDGPRGRIYLIKSMLEDAPTGTRTQRHLDRCLTCRACETTCPSGVRYSRLLELARPMVEARVARGRLDRVRRWLIRQVVPYRSRFAFLLALARACGPLLPASVRELVPAVRRAVQRPPRPTRHARHAVLLEGCAQAVTAPSIDAAAQDVCDDLGCSLDHYPGAGCCGAVAYHMGHVDEARQFARRNVDAWTPALDGGAEAVVATSSGCAMMLKEYGALLVDDTAYAARASRVAQLVRDPAELIDPVALGERYRAQSPRRVAFHAPCTLQHGLHVQERVSECLRAVGFELSHVADAHLCCGSAGSYSLLQPRIANALLERKLAALGAGAPDEIASANIGCLMHLAKRADKPVRHWLEVVREHRRADAPND